MAKGLFDLQRGYGPQVENHCSAGYDLTGGAIGWGSIPIRFEVVLPRDNCFQAPIPGTAWLSSQGKKPYCSLTSPLIHSFIRSFIHSLSEHWLRTERRGDTEKAAVCSTLPMADVKYDMRVTDGEVGREETSGVWFRAATHCGLSTSPKLASL